MCKDSIYKKLFYPIFNFAAHSILPTSLQEARTFYIQCFQRREVLLQHLPITSLSPPYHLICKISSKPCFCYYTRKNYFPREGTIFS